MSTALRFPLTTLAVAALVATLSAGAARADENLLHGPHPFLKDNELSAHVLVAAGGGRTPGGAKLGLDYGYKLGAPLWLNLELNYLHSNCHSQGGEATCEQATGEVFETFAGVKAKWPTPIPVVPYAKLAGGLAFEFPDGAPNGWGLAGHVAGGANYFFFDWLALGAELGVSFGHLSTSPAGYSEIDFGGGVEFQF